MMELLRVAKGISKAVAVIILVAAFVCFYKVQNDGAVPQNNTEYALNYHSNMETALANAQRLLNYSLFSDKQSFFYLNTMKYSKDINKIIDVEVKPANTTAIEKLMEYSFVPILFALIMIIVSIQYLLETRNGIKKIVRASAVGRGCLALKRTGIMAVVCAALSIIMNFVILGILLLFYGGAADLHCPVQSVPIFSLFPYRMTILQFFLWYCLFFAFAMFAVGQLIYLIMQSSNMSKLSYIIILFIYFCLGIYFVFRDTGKQQTVFP